MIASSLADQLANTIHTLVNFEPEIYPTLVTIVLMLLPLPLLVIVHRDIASRGQKAKSGTRAKLRAHKGNESMPSAYPPGMGFDRVVRKWEKAGKYRTC